MSISSLTNTNNLASIKTWLAVRGIKSSMYTYIARVNSTPLRKRVSGITQTACSLNISSSKQVERFLEVLEKEITSDFLFYGVKQRDYLLMRAFLVS